jgi:hypothetical protein
MLTGLQKLMCEWRRVAHLGYGVGYPGLVAGALARCCLRALSWICSRVLRRHSRSPVRQTEWCMKCRVFPENIMDTITPSVPNESRSWEFQARDEAHSTGVSWGAVVGGAFVAAAFYLVLVALGAGFGLSAVSPWSNVGLSASTIGTLGIVWLVFIEFVASALGGYLTGRLRTKWVSVHTDEVYFRDTANGFLSWAVALVLSVSLLASAAMSMAGHMPASEKTGEAVGGTIPEAYFVDQLFRSDHSSTDINNAEVRAEAGRILSNALRHGETPAADQAYLTQLVAAKVGISQPDAEKRVAQVITDARQVEDVARKNTAHLLLWIFIALMAGAFSASYAATIGGRQRDHMRAV